MAVTNNNSVSVTGGGAFPPEKKLSQQDISLNESLQIEPVEEDAETNATGSNVLKDDIVNLSSDRES